VSSEVKVLRPVGILNATCANKLRGIIGDSIQAKQVNILIDCAGIEFMDSMGLSCLIMSLKKVRTAGGSLALTNTNSQIRLLLEVAALEDSFKMNAESLVVIKTTSWKNEPIFYLENL
jgi:anti-sigma B factor antagonist